MIKEKLNKEHSQIKDISKRLNAHIIKDGYVNGFVNRILSFIELQRKLVSMVKVWHPLETERYIIFF